MEKVFITGRGLITPIGKGLAANRQALKEGKSGIVFCESYHANNLPSVVAGIADETPDANLLDRKMLRFSPPAATMSVSAVYEALQEAGLTPDDIRGKRIAVIGGTANSFGKENTECTMNFMQSGKLRAVPPFSVPRVMPSSAVSIISLFYGLKGESFDISAACATSTISIIQAVRLIRSGEYDMVIAGGAEQLDWTQALGFCAMRALSTKFADNPAASSRPFDRNRDGFVLANGAAWVILESEKSIKKRNGKAITEISGIASNSNATDMVVPDAAASEEVMRLAIADAGLEASDIQYVNTHGTSTPVGDPVEMQAIKNVFGSSVAINSTKSQTGHMIGATGAAEIIFTSIMLEDDFISPTINLDEPEEEFAWADLVKEYRPNAGLKHAISNSFAFGGSNACVTLSKVK
ncbi:MAG: beta-ketoacyl-[Lentisphaeria bacterium]|nr:beta-ketoacyl-[acyl-carrier-protein] synthase family protein [Lentisphaeria bacterium]